MCVVVCALSTCFPEASKPPLLRHNSGRPVLCYAAASLRGNMIKGFEAVALMYYLVPSACGGARSAADVAHNHKKKEKKCALFLPATRQRIGSMYQHPYRGLQQLPVSSRQSTYDAHCIQSQECSPLGGLAPLAVLQAFAASFEDLRTGPRIGPRTDRTGASTQYPSTGGCCLLYVCNLKTPPLGQVVLLPGLHYIGSNAHN